MKIQEFLTAFREGGSWVLTAITPDRGTTTQTFTCPDRAATWAEAQNGQGRNLYFHVNPTKGPMTKKAAKTDISALEYLHVDLDPRNGEDRDTERERILGRLTGFSPEPTFILDSGNGYQAFWRLKTPEPLGGEADTERVEGYNLQLEYELGADKCHNTDRLMRLPGTTNYPNAKKRAKGRTEAQATVVAYNPEAVYPLTRFTPAPSDVGRNPAKTTQAASAPVDWAKVQDVGTEALRVWAKANGKVLKESTLAIIATGTDPVDGEHFPSRSEALFRVCCDLIRAGVPDDMILGVITGGNVIAESVREQKNPRQYAQRQVGRAKEAVAEEGLQRWATFQLSDKGLTLPTFHNFRAATLRLGRKIRWDTFRGKVEVDGEPLTDLLEYRLAGEISRRFQLEPSEPQLHRAIMMIAEQNAYDSLQESLLTLPTWDGNPRLDTWLTDFCGAEDNAFTREAGAVWLTAAVARAFIPGVYFRHMLVLEGQQETGKSTVFRILAGGRFFSDAAVLSAETPQRVLEATEGAWIMECAELDGIDRRDVTALKALISARTDKGRKAYSRNASEVSRRFVFGGTTNESRYLVDETGNSRFLPVRTGTIDLSGLSAQRDQLLAEALKRFRDVEATLRRAEDTVEAGAYPLSLQSAEAKRVGREAQQARQKVDEGFAETLSGFNLAERHPKYGWIALPEKVYHFLGIPRKDRGTATVRKVAAAMKAVGWEPNHPVWVEGRPQKAYRWTGDGEPLTTSVPADYEQGGLSPF